MDYYKYVETTNFNETNDAGPDLKKGEDIFQRIANYQKAFDGDSTTTLLYDPLTKTKVSPPLGMSYFYKTDINCSNYPDQSRYTFVDAKTSSQKTILSAATADINNIKPIIQEDPISTICVKKTYTTIGTDGKRKSETQYIGKETFVVPSLEKMNVGQQLFIGSFAVLGLFLFYKAFHKR